MKQLFFFILFSLITISVFAEKYTAVGSVKSEGAIAYQLQSDLKDSYSNSFLSSEKISLTFEINVAEQDIGFVSSLYLLVKYNDKAYIKNSADTWIPMSNNIKTLASFEQRKLQASEKISILSQTNLAVGEYLVFFAYKSRNGDIKYNKSAASFVVFAENSPALHSVKNNDFLISFLNKAHNGNNNNVFGMFSGSSFSGGSDAPTASSGSSISQTNLQELGVDEGDKIKTWENTLFTLGRCGNIESLCANTNAFEENICKTQLKCLTSYTMEETPAATVKLAQIPIGESSSNELYLHNNNSGQTAVALSSDSSYYPIWSIWDFFTFWQGNEIKLSLFDVSLPENMQLKNKITIDGRKIASRVVGDVLYLLSRNSSDYAYIQPFSISTQSVTGFFDDEQAQREKLTEEQLLPRIQFDNGDPIALVDATNCYLPMTKSSQQYDQTLITLTAIPINDPKNFKSICISGDIETFYMSSESMYLASSKRDYQQQGNTIMYDPQLEYTTDIHKFSFKGTELSYRGSGKVAGHLGWDRDKRSFRFGEHKGILKVATSLGRTWSGTASTRVGVFKEDPQTKTLIEIAHLDNLGKPGEKLYAARFIEDRGFLVTFRVTDPLYMLDFSDPYKPQIMGELEIDGYSDYLHPIGKNYLLGLGKDAIADVNTNRGAWYQGVKLSLFDISEPGNLKEVQSLIIGKRGTSSNALYDHHAFTWLDKGNGQATLALPIALHETTYYTSSYVAQENAPWQYYSEINTGLYVFNIDTDIDPGISIMGTMINNNDDAYTGIGNDRSVIQGDSIHYIHDNNVYSSTLDSLFY